GVHRRAQPRPEHRVELVRADALVVLEARLELHLDQQWLVVRVGVVPRRDVVHAGAQVLIPGPAGRGAVVVVPEWMVVADRPGREGRPDVDLDHAGAGGERLGEVRERGLLVAVVQAADRDLAERRASTFGRGGSRCDGRRDQDGHY